MWPWEISCALMRCIMEPGRRRSGSSTERRAGGAGSWLAAATRSAILCGWPDCFHWAMHWLSIHMPLTLTWKQVRPPTAVRLVKPSCAASGDVMGVAISAPTSDQVPEEM